MEIEIEELILNTLQEIRRHKKTGKAKGKLVDGENRIISSWLKYHRTNCRKGLSTLLMEIFKVQSMVQHV